MARTKSAEDLATLQMALVGYQLEKTKIEEKIREIEGRLSGKKATAGSAAADKKASGVKRVLSPAARRRIALAQKKRWAEHRKKMSQATKSQ
jgi:predicted  nucleic acid-binding Zn-ribbon protein